MGIKDKSEIDKSEAIVELEGLEEETKHMPENNVGRGWLKLGIIIAKHLVRILDEPEAEEVAGKSAWQVPKV